MAVWRTDGAAKQIIRPAPRARGEAAPALPAAPGAHPGTGGSWWRVGDNRSLGEHPTVTLLLLRGWIGCQTPLVPQFPQPCRGVFLLCEFQNSAHPQIAAWHREMYCGTAPLSLHSGKGQLRKAHFTLIFLFASLPTILKRGKSRRRISASLQRFWGTMCMCQGCFDPPIKQGFI